MNPRRILYDAMRQIENDPTIPPSQAAAIRHEFALIRKLGMRLRVAVCLFAEFRKYEGRWN